MLERRGIDPTALFREAGLDPERLSKPRARYPGKEARLAWSRASEIVGDPGFGLTSAEVWEPTDFHALGIAFLASTTLRNALNRLVRYHALVDNQTSYSLVEQGDQAILSFNLEQDAGDEPAILEDSRWAVVLDACRRVYGPDLDPLEITFLHADPGAAMGKFYGFFRCPMRFGEPVSSLTFPAAVLDKPLPASNRELALAHDRVLGEFVGRLQRDDIVSRTKSAISDWLPSGNFTSEAVAGALHMSPRSLQRKLAAEDTTFRQLVEQVRQELARSYLADGRFTLLEISYLLGFSTQSAFSRAFKRWMGSTPQEFRNSA
jgi:AraC-like DNA-binding protein